jgi:hypothetical protein
MLHVHGGSVLLDALRAAGLPGGFLEWGEVLCFGPTPAGLDPEAWRRTRATFLDDAFGPADGRSTAEQLAEQDRRLAAADDLVLWFGPELFCQAILIAVLARLTKAGHDETRLSLLCFDRYPGVDDDRGCTPSYLSAEQLREVFAKRPAVTAAQLDLARRSWDAWCAPTPDSLAVLAGGALPELPYLAEALQRHLEELPAVGTGLSLTETRVLEVLGGGGRELTFARLFLGVTQLERRRWLTDLMFLHVVRSLALAPTPLVEIRGSSAWQRSPYRTMWRDLGPAMFQMTAPGERVLEGELDAVALNGLDRWVGGIHLTPGTLWRWDRATRRVVPPR